MTRNDLRAWLATRPGWKQDMYGNFKDAEGVKRWKLKALVVRYEVKSMGGTWLAIRSGYYGKLSITPEGKLKGMDRLGAFGQRY